MNRRDFLKSSAVAPLSLTVPNVTVGADGVTKITVEGGSVIIDEKTYRIIVLDTPHILQAHRKICDLIEAYPYPNVGLDITSDNIFYRITDTEFIINDKWKVSDSDCLKFTGGTIQNRGIYAYKFLGHYEEDRQYYADRIRIELDWNKEYRSFKPIKTFIATDELSAYIYEIDNSIYKDILVPVPL